jgi:hypothetical protein
VKIRLFQLALFVSTLAFAVVVASVVIHRRYSPEHWFDSRTPRETVSTVRRLGTNALTFLVKKLDGPSPARERAAYLIGETSTNTPLAPEIAAKLISLLTTGSQAEQLDAYNTLHKLGIEMPAADLTMAARTCPSIRDTEEQLTIAPKLQRLYSMTNTLDCGYLAQLFNDAAPEVQMEAIGFLGVWDRHHPKAGYCDDEITAALATLMNTGTNPAVLNCALGYMSTSPKIMIKNLPAICHLLAATKDAGLQMECLSLVAAAGRSQPLSAEVRQRLELNLTRSELSSDVRREIQTRLAITD